MLKSQRTVELKKDYFYIKADAEGYRNMRIKYDELVYVKAMQNYVLLFMNNGQQYCCHNSLKQMEEMLSNSDFTKIHRSYIVNDHKILAIEGDTLVLDTNKKTKIIIGRTYKSDFNFKNNCNILKKDSKKIIDIGQHILLLMSIFCSDTLFLVDFLV